MRGRAAADRPRFHRLAAAAITLLVCVGCASAPSPSATASGATPSVARATGAIAATPTPTGTAASASATAATSPTAPAANTPIASPSSAPTVEPSAAAPSPSLTPGQPPRPIFASVNDAYAQTVTWHDCGFPEISATCATVFVPTVYEQPDAGTTAIAVARISATGTSHPDLFVNPGGPGSPGINYARGLAGGATGLSSSFDIVGFDPRGTGASDPLVCLDTAALDKLNAFDPTPETPQERQQGIDLVTAQGAACAQNSGLLAAHVTTIEAARDMDVLRAVLGDNKMDYFGASYGTFLGTTYAALFPDKVDRFVLDGALPPNLNSMEIGEVQTRGFETAITAYINDCVRRGASCPLGTTAAAAKTRLRQLLVDADQNPLPTNDPARSLTEDLAFFGVVATLYRQSSWPSLTDALTAALVGNGQRLLALADDYFGRADGHYVTNLIQANQAINCLDEQVAGGPTSIPEATFIADSPIAGDIMYGLSARGCGDWPLKTRLTPPDYSAPGTPTIVVVGTTRDPATPYIWAQQLAKTLSNAVLLTRDGDGHTAYTSGNPCIIGAVNAFLVDGVVPADGKRC